VKVAAALRHCFLAPPSSSPSDSTRSCESRISEVIAQETFQKARSLARKVKKATDPTVQRNIDELLSRLQKKFGVRPEPSRSSGAMSFSDAELDTMRKELIILSAACDLASSKSTRARLGDCQMMRLKYAIALTLDSCHLLQKFRRLPIGLLVLNTQELPTFRGVAAGILV
ncbi:unnamed protein product, partial [Polarella glacialis]